MMTPTFVSEANSASGDSKICIVIESANSLSFHSPEGGDVYAKPALDSPYLRFELWDSEQYSSDRPLGCVDIDLTQLRDGPWSSGNYHVGPLHGVGGGQLCLRMQLTRHAANAENIAPSTPIMPFQGGAAPYASFQGMQPMTSQPWPPGRAFHQQQYGGPPLPHSGYQQPPYQQSSMLNQQGPQGFSGGPYQQQQQQQLYGHVPFQKQVEYASFPQASRMGQTPYHHPPGSQQGPSRFNQPYMGGQMSAGGGLQSTIDELHAILPQVSRSRIESVLEKHNGDKEKALAELLEDELSNISSTITASPHTVAHPALGSGQPLQPQSYAADFIHSQYAEPPTWVQPQYGLRRAAEVAPSHIPPPIYAGQGRRKSLLIGINYTGTSAELRGCVLDVQRMRRLLTTVYGFPSFPEAMVCLTDDNPDWRFQPTRKNILYAMKWLVQDARPGDVFFFHYSGHGAQARNLDGTEEDGMDETILPVDYKQEGMIHDNDLHALLVQPLPSGTRLTALLDCCHSGTGMDLPFVWNQEEFDWQEEYCPFYTAGDVQLLAGCEDHQTSADVQSATQNMPAGGAMTTAFISAITANPHGHSYPSLMQHLKNVLVSRGIRRQTPQLSATQRFPIERQFNLTDIVPNTNPMLGRQFKKTRSSRTVETTADSGDVDPLAMMGGIGLLGAAVGLSGAMFSDLF